MDTPAEVSSEVQVLRVPRQCWKGTTGIARAEEPVLLKRWLRISEDTAGP